MAEQITVIVIDDHSLFRTGVVQSLGLDDTIKVLAEGASGTEAVNLAKAHAPKLALLDISMPGNGIEAAREICNLPHAPKVVMLTVSEDDHDIVNALEAGASGYILKGVKAQELISAIKSVSAGDSYVSPNLTLRLLAHAEAKSQPSAFASLSQQEERTLRLIATGLSNREIGNKLGILEKTVKFHMSNIKRKLKVRNRVEAALLARQQWRDEKDITHG